MGSETARRIIDQTLESEKFMIAAFRVEDGELHLDRVSNNFPYEAFREAMRLLQANLEEENRSLRIHPRSSLKNEQPDS